MYDVCKIVVAICRNVDVFGIVVSIKQPTRTSTYEYACTVYGQTLVEMTEEMFFTLQPRKRLNCTQLGRGTTANIEGRKVSGRRPH